MGLGAEREKEQVPQKPCSDKAWLQSFCSPLWTCSQHTRVNSKPERTEDPDPTHARAAELIETKAKTANVQDTSQKSHQNTKFQLLI